MPRPEDIVEWSFRRLLPHRWARASVGRYRFSRSSLVFVSFPKSGRTWLLMMLSCYWKERYRLPQLELVGSANLHRRDPRIPRVHFTHDESYKVRPDELSPDKGRYAGKHVVFLSRDPRDVAVSLYFQRTRRDRDWQGELSDFVFGEAGGLATAATFLAHWAAALRTLPHALAVRYEDLKDDPAGELTRVLAFAGEAPDPAAVARAVASASFESMRDLERSGALRRNALRPGDAGDGDSFKVRRGKVGGWLDYLDPSDVARADRIVEEHLGGAFGYVASTGEPQPDPPPSS